MWKSWVYFGNNLLGEVEIYPQNNHNREMMMMTTKEIKISHFSQPSERCSPLAVVHTIASSSSGVFCFKMESKLLSDDSPLLSLHSSCIREKKTAIMQLGDQELHLVAMSSRKTPQQSSCFWGFSLAAGLYNSCLVMLNLRCLGIVFDLDETLIVANTMRSFEDRIDALQRKLNTEIDPHRISGMQAEIKRYQEDRIILKQYVEYDQVVENGKVIKIQSEVVPALSDNHEPVVRPLIRLQEKNIILTRINPLIRDTSVLVRLRPAWEELRNYLTARGRKRFEVYVCTMAERDYALEMWRLLDPESSLINLKQLLDRVVCVKAGSKKSLLNVFHDGICHPTMSLVIDDRLKVWEENDQERVHVVPAFAPYYAPQAEANNTTPILCLARNVACNVRGSYFKMSVCTVALACHNLGLSNIYRDFDEGLLQKIPVVFYEDCIADIPSAPDVSNYLISEDAPLASSMVNNPEIRVAPSFQLAATSSSNSISQFPVIAFNNESILPQSQTPLMVNPMGHGSPVEIPESEEGEVPDSELDPDTRRRLLILQHGHDARENTAKEPPFPVRPPLQVSVPPAQPRGWSPLQEEIMPKQPNRPPQPPSKDVRKEGLLESENLHFDSRRRRRPSFFHGVESSAPRDRPPHENQRMLKQARHGDDRLRLNPSMSNYHPLRGDEVSLSSASTKSDCFETERSTPPFAETSTEVLQDIAMACETKVEFRSALVPGLELKFSIEVWFAGEKVGEGVGKTRKEAQLEAAERSLNNLANNYLSTATFDKTSVHGDMNKISHANNNGFSNAPRFLGPQPIPEEPIPIASTSELSRFPESMLEGSKKSVGLVSALKELCMAEGLALVFQAQPPLSTISIQKGESYAQVEVGGQVVGRGIGTTWDEAKIQAAEEALGNLKSTLDQGSQKRVGSPRSLQVFPNKRLKQESPRVLQRIPSLARYSNTAPPAP
ncbi:hypothetical protein GIB67_021276 [Kingdonia uniflora]|uniref:protein-serine/threonine phosphatase n=1 Tax=Kingdonia uniflora TaxID=39325 RepID=A0A7J7LG03_9MAGN|nr:hypothetical protein GIB67_021276 [Kingdonia uniflora]